MEAGRLLRDARRARGLGQVELARRAATTQTYVSRVERGVVSPSWDSLQRLLRAMGLQLTAGVEPLSAGNADLGRLRASLRDSSPQERVEEAMDLSAFLTQLAVDANRETTIDETL